jgi:branched-chain amino acid transport system permease protein
MIKLILIAVIILLPLIFSGLRTGNYLMLLLCFMLVYIVAVSGLDILFGYCGQISLGHAGFFAIGAYGSAILQKMTGVSPLLTAVVSSIIAMAVAAFIAFPAAKLKFHFLSLATVAFGEIIYQLISASPGGITGNFVGYFPKPMSIFGYEFDTYTKFYYFALVIVAIALLVKYRIVKSKTGRALEAIRENTFAANGMGINVRKYKMIAFCVSAFYVSFSGAIYGHLVEYISPGLFTFDQSVIFLTMVLFGGSGSIFGAVLGASAIQIMNELLRNLEQYYLLFYGIFLLIVILFMPNGLVRIKFKRRR